MPLDDENVTLSPEVTRRLAPPSPTTPLDERLTKQLSAAWSLESDIGSIAAAQPAPDYWLPYEDPEAARNYTVEDKPTPEEIRTCRPFLEAPLAALPKLRVVVALGQIEGYLLI